MSYLVDFQKSLENHNFPRALTLWEEYCMGDSLDPRETIEILELIKKSDSSSHFGRAVEKILPLWNGLPASAEKDQILKLIFDLETTNSEELWELARTEIERRFGTSEHFVEKFRIAGLRNHENLQGVISNFELLNHLQKGNYVYHSKGWGVGEILDFSLLREQIAIDFDFLPGSHEVSFETAFKTLVPISSNHFLAQRFGNPDRLEKKAKEDPLAVIHLILKDLGPKTAGELKDELYELVIPADDWAKWWQSTRAKLKKDTFVDCPSRLSDPFCLRKSEISHEESLQKLLEKKPKPQLLIQTIYSFLKDFPEILKNEEFKATLTTRLKETLSSQKLTTAEEIQILFLLESLSDQPASQDFSKYLSHEQDLPKLLDSISILSFKKRLLSEIRQQTQNWKEIFLQLLLSLDQNPPREFVFNELLEGSAAEECKKKLEELCAQPTRHPEAFFWYFLKLIGKNASLPFADAEGKSRFFEALLILLSYIEQTPGHKEMMKKIYQLIIDDRYALVRDIFKIATPAACQEFLLLATKCQSFTDHDIKILHSLAAVAHPSLEKKKKKKEEASLVVWTTQEGFKKTQAYLQKLATIDVVENAKEIEVARAHGDLRENSEFKAALEHRDRLQSEIKTLSDQLNVARIITSHDISTEQVGIGTVVDCTDSKGKTVSFTLLGPWDADIEKNILSFQSKLAQSMKDLSIGDSFQAQGETLTIKAIRSYLD